MNTRTLVHLLGPATRPRSCRRGGRCTISRTLTVLGMLLCSSVFSSGLFSSGTLLAQDLRSAQPGSADEQAQDARLQTAKERYHFDAWPAGAKRTGVPLAALRFVGYVREPIEFTPGFPVTVRFRDEAGTPRFLVELTVSDTSRRAREELAEYLSSVSSLRRVPTARSQGIDVGEIGFVGLAARDRISWVAFVRGNVTARACCLDPRRDPPVDMRYVSKAVDSVIVAQPILASKERPAESKAVLRASRARCRAGEAIDLDVSVDPAPAALNWVVGGPGQGYVERDDQGRWRLYTTGPGLIELTLHVLGPNGVATSRRVRLEVAAE